MHYSVPRKNIRQKVEESLTKLLQLANVNVRDVQTALLWGIKSKGQPTFLYSTHPVLRASFSENNQDHSAACLIRHISSPYLISSEFYWYHSENFIFCFHR